MFCCIALPWRVVLPWRLHLVYSNIVCRHHGRFFGQHQCGVEHQVCIRNILCRDWACRICARFYRGGIKGAAAGKLGKCGRSSIPRKWSLIQYLSCRALICLYYLFLQIAIIAKRLALAVGETRPSDVKGTSIQLILLLTTFCYCSFRISSSKWFRTNWNTSATTCSRFG